MSQKPTESVDLDFETYSSEKQSSIPPTKLSTMHWVLLCKLRKNALRMSKKVQSMSAYKQMFKINPCPFFFKMCCSSSASCIHIHPKTLDTTRCFDTSKS